MGLRTWLRSKQRARRSRALKANYEWRLDGRRLSVLHPKREIFWLLPEGVGMPSPSTLSLAEFLLFTPYGETLPVIASPPRVGGGSAVAFSGGVDSAACMRLLPGPIPIYSQFYRPRGSHKVENALLATHALNGISVVTNYNKLSTAFGHKYGVYGDGGFSISAVLLSEHLGINTIAEGHIIDFVYLRGRGGHGTIYNPHDFTAAMNAFRRAGLNLCLPCAGLSEVSTTKIASGFRYVMGCMRGTGGVPCLSCIKCFRKEALLGRPVPSNEEVDRKLSAEAIPMLGALLWAKQFRGLKHPRLEGVTKDLSWVDKWYPDSIRYIPEHLRRYFLDQLQKYEIAPIEDQAALVAWDARVPVGTPRHGSGAGNAPIETAM